MSSLPVMCVKCKQSVKLSRVDCPKCKKSFHNKCAGAKNDETGCFASCLIKPRTQSSSTSSQELVEYRPKSCDDCMSALKAISDKFDDAMEELNTKFDESIYALNNKYSAAIKNLSRKVDDSALALNDKMDKVKEDLTTDINDIKASVTNCNKKSDDIQKKCISEMNMRMLK